MKKYLFFFLFLAFFACKNEKKPKTEKEFFTQFAEGNIFSDEKIQEIYKLQYERNAEVLIYKMKSDFFGNPEYLKHAIISLASVQDTQSIETLSQYFNNNNLEIRKATAYTLGQIRHIDSEKKLIEAYKAEKESVVKEEILNSIGKCGTETGLNFIIKQGFPTNNIGILSGSIKGISKFSERKIVSKNITKKILSILSNNETNNDIKYWCSYYLYKSKVNLTRNSKELISAFKNAGFLYTKNNIIKACSQSTSAEIKDFLIKIISSEDTDYRLKADAVKSLQNFKYEDIEESLINLLNDSNEHVAVTASEYFINFGNTKQAAKYFNIAKALKSWQTRTNMFTASLKHIKNKKEISQAIISGYEASENLYEKSKLLEALSYDLSRYNYLKKETFNSEYKVLSTFGISSLCNMRKSKDFNSFAKKSQVNFEAEFAEIFKKAIMSGDVALVSLSAEIIINPDFNYQSVYKNTYFIKQALNKCILPRDYEAYIILRKADEYINGTVYTEESDKIEHKKPDWKLIKSIPPEQKVKFCTKKGDFIIELNINDSPFSVSAFIQLIMDGFYNNKAIHRVVTNFVIQGGCPGGDGWRGAPFAIRSEFSPLKYSEGTVGLASSGKDTESSQWFITHTPTPHLNGRYTIIGKVTEGLEIIHKIQVGDKIIRAEMLRNYK